MPSSRAAIDMTILNTEPGANLERDTRFWSGWRGSLTRRSQMSCENRWANTLGSYAGREIIARTAPEFGSRKTAEPASSA